MNATKIIQLRKEVSILLFEQNLNRSAESQARLIKLQRELAILVKTEKKRGIKP